MAGIAKLWKSVVNVTDLDEGERFWCAVSGLAAEGRHGGQFSVLGPEDETFTDPWLLLQLVPVGQTSHKSGTHLDFRVDDVAAAARQIEDVGGKTVKAPAVYEADGAPMLEWAIMQDPFGNEFCIIRYPV